MSKKKNKKQNPVQPWASQLSTFPKQGRKYTHAQNKQKKHGKLTASKHKVLVTGISSKLFILDWNKTKEKRQNEFQFLKTTWNMDIYKEDTLKNFIYFLTCIYFKHSSRHTCCAVTSGEVRKKHLGSEFSVPMTGLRSSGLAASLSQRHLPRSIIVKNLA